MINFLKRYNRDDEIILQIKETILNSEEKRMNVEKIATPIITNAIPVDEPKVEETKQEVEKQEEVLTIDEALSLINNLSTSVGDYHAKVDAEDDVPGAEEELFKNEQVNENEH